ncbi:hypothetical protein [Patiriisocius marinus]|uniref:Lipocalin-like domain-containing protein n=1 Tax=Patiriisocius marinus TaxID=1397112 RepID=A0A5J4J4I9_9FLAO|nr:hypothetical protein [Patiriisocius marinus]GER60948.1 hypothetical protein ULMA_30560 [Patiriisocius marinus]
MKPKMIFFLLLSSLLLSCGSDDDGNANNSNSAAQTTQIAQDGTWRVTKFIDSGDDETSDFSSYTFTFNDNGTVNASNDIRTVSGTWSVTDDSSNSSSDDDGNSSSDDDFLLLFTVSESDDFEDLNDDWDFVSVSVTKIELIDVSGGNGGTDLLTFERN